MSLRANSDRRAKRFGLSLLILFAGWVAFVCFYDETLDPGFKVFYFKDQARIPDDQNAAIGLLGLSAPAGSDFMEHGRAVVRNWRELARGGGRIVMPGKLESTVQQLELDCWIAPENYSKDSHCASESRLATLLKENAELLARYRQVYQLPHFGGVPITDAVLLDLNKLIVAEIRLDLRRHRTRQAYEKWRDNHRLLVRAMAADGTWLDKAIIQVSQAFSLSVAELLLQTSPRLATEHYAELLELLRPLELSEYNLPGVLRAEYLLFDPLFGSPETLRFWVHPNFVRNRFYWFAQDLVETFRHPDGLDKRIEALRQKHILSWNADYLRDPLNALYVRTLLDGQVKAGVLVEGMHLKMAYTRLLSLKVRILKARIPDSEIEAFLRNSEEELRNPLTGKPMRWNSIKRAIYFDVPGNRREPNEVKL